MNKLEDTPRTHNSIDCESISSFRKGTVFPNCGLCLEKNTQLPSQLPLSRHCLTSSASKRSPVLLVKFRGRLGSGRGYSVSLSFTTSVVGQCMGPRTWRGRRGNALRVNPISQLVNHQMQRVWIFVPHISI